MPFDHLLDLLPPGAVLTDVTRPDGKPAVNIKAANWQGAVPLSDDPDADEIALIALAWSLQAGHEHHVKVEAANKVYQAQLDALTQQHHTDLDAKIKKAKDDLKAKKTGGNVS